MWRAHVGRATRILARYVQDGPITKLTLAYDGAAFAGWARQPGLRTVQEELERAIERILGRAARAERRRAHRPRRARVGAGRELPSRGARPTQPQRAAARRRRGTRKRAGCGWLRRAPQRASPHLLLPRARRAACARPSSMAARCGCPGGSTPMRCTRAPCAAGHASLHSLHADRDRPRSLRARACSPRAGSSAATCSSSGSRRTASCAR